MRSNGHMNAANCDRNSHYDSDDWPWIALLVLVRLAAEELFQAFAGKVGFTALG